MDLHDNQDLDCKINLLNSTTQNQDFLRKLKNILEYNKLFDLATTEEKIYKNVLPFIIDRFLTVYNNNNSLFETFDDEVMGMVIRENLEIAFELTETLQESLNFIYQHNALNAGDIESILGYVPKCVLAFADHWNHSSEQYKHAFSAELSKLLEVIKHLYVSFLHILEYSVIISDNNDKEVLVRALPFICELTKNLYHELDKSGGLVISSWKCFGTVTAKYSTALETCMDLRMPIAALSEDIVKVLVIITNKEMNAFPQNLKMISFLIKILFKITDTFYQHLDIFGLDLLIFFVKTSSLALKKNDQLSAEALVIIDKDVFKSLDVFLEHLVIGQPDFKNHLEKISDYIENIDVFRKYPSGIINFSCKILHMAATIRSDWCLITNKFIEVIFITLLDDKELCLDRLDEEIYQQLILNISAAILLQDVSFQSADILLRHILQDDVCVALLALEIYILVISNVHSEESITLVINLLYGVNDLLCGYFTNRPEIVFLKQLLQRIFKTLPDTLKDEIIKLFKPDQCIQVWRFLGFNSLPVNQVQLIIDPVVNNTSELMRSILGSCSEDMPLNIAEGLNLISTVDDLDINESKFGEIRKFLHTFWTTDLNFNEILDNNIMKYFILRITQVTSICIQNSFLDLEIVTPNLKTLSCKESYWITVYKIISSILNSMPLINLPEMNKQRILRQISDIVNLPVQNKSNTLLQENYLELFKSLNESQQNNFNFLLDSFNTNVAGQIFQYLEKCSTQSYRTHLNHKSCFYHKCLNWKVSTDTTILPQVKRPKMEVQLPKTVKSLELKENVQPDQLPHKTGKMKNTAIKQRRDLGSFTSHEEEDNSSATEVIGRIKGEVKCLLKICKTEKLTQKNVTDLRILMSQMSSLM